MLSRRRFLLVLPGLAALPACAQSFAGGRFASPFHRKPAPARPLPLVFFGTDTAHGTSRGIYRARFDPATGRLTAPQLVAETPRPSFLALSPAAAAGGRRLYAVNAVADSSATVTSFAIDPASGALRRLDQVSSAGAGPCYVSLDDSGTAAFVADYSGGTIASYRVEADGNLSEPVEHINFRDARFGHRGPVAARQDGPHPHSVHLSPDNRFLLVSDLGSDAISVFALEPGARLSEPAVFPNDRPGCGPRHIAFHPNRRWMYSINEIDSTIDHFLWTTTSSRVKPEGLLVNTNRPVKTIANSFPAAKNTAAEIAVSPDGNFVYASNRGEDTLVVFTVGESGELTLLQRLSCGGRTPRQFTLDPSGRWILCGNQDSATVTVFRRDGGTGRLSGPVQTVPLDSVMFTLFA